jgi:hypothetical protein
MKISEKDARGLLFGLLHTHSIAAGRTIQRVHVGAKLCGVTAPLAVADKVFPLLQVLASFVGTLRISE